MTVSAAVCRILPRVMLAAAAAGRTDVLHGLCSILEDLVLHAPHAAHSLLPPLADPPTWPEVTQQPCSCRGLQGIAWEVISPD